MTYTLFAARIAAASLLAAVCGAGVSASAQDASQSPNFGATNLQAGFEPDPFTVQMTAGGDIDASHLGGACVGKITSAPDYRINYTAGSSLALTIRFRSREDTTLIINRPNGRWDCNDDAGDGINPGIVYRQPLSGTYDIWVGTYGDTPAAGQLRVTELE